MVENLLYVLICERAQLMSQLGIVRHAVNCYSHLTKTRHDTINPPAKADTRSLVFDRVLRRQGAAHNTQHIFLYNSYFKLFIPSDAPTSCAKDARRTPLGLHVRVSSAADYRGVSTRQTSTHIRMSKATQN